MLDTFPFSKPVVLFTSGKSRPALSTFLSRKLAGTMPKKSPRSFSKEKVSII